MLSASTQHHRLKGRPDSILWDSCGSNAQFGTPPREAPYTLSCLAKPSEGPWQARGAWGMSVTGMAGPSVQSSVPWQGHRDLFPARHSAGLSEPQQVPYPCRLGRPGVCCVSLSASYFWSPTKFPNSCWCAHFHFADGREEGADKGFGQCNR